MATFNKVDSDTVSVENTFKRKVSIQVLLDELNKISSQLDSAKIAGCTVAVPAGVKTRIANL